MTTSRTSMPTWRRSRGRWITRRSRSSTTETGTVVIQRPGFCRAACFLSTFSATLGMTGRPRMQRSNDSEIQHQSVGLAAGAADHDALVLGLLFLAQDRVVVIRDAGD